MNKKFQVELTKDLLTWYFTCLTFDFNVTEEYCFTFLIKPGFRLTVPIEKVSTLRIFCLEEEEYDV
jgi:hypothetical protein